MAKSGRPHLHPREPVPDSPQSKTLGSVQLLLPPGPWIVQLLTREIAMGPSTYVTVCETDSFIETSLHPFDTKVLKALWLTLGIEIWRFCYMIAEALHQAWKVHVHLRLSTEVHGQGRGQITFVDPASPQSNFVLGINLHSLMNITRTNRLVRLCLGTGLQRPIEVIIEVPPIPRVALSRLIDKLGPTPLIAIPLPLTGDFAAGVPPEAGQHLVLGPLPAR